jgi:LuxR family quorum sensing-dependent transcriptional regulator
MIRAKADCAPQPSCLRTDLLAYIAVLDQIQSPAAVLDALHDITWPLARIGVIGAAMFPIRRDKSVGLEKSKTVFLHPSVPAAWWEEYLELSRANPSPGVMLAQSALAPFTMTETLKMFEPLGVDRWPYELALKYGMRDGLSCPVGGRWVIAYWSPKVLAGNLLQEDRALLFMAASFVAIRLQQLIAPCSKRLGNGVSLTPRELAVLRSLSLGRRVRETAERLGLGEETVRSHLKKAQAKLGVNERTHAVAQAMRLHLIP